MTKYDLLFDFADKAKSLSKCKHGQVAAILTNWNFTKISSIGINGGAMNQADCLCGDKDAKYGCVHAEINCLVKNRDWSGKKVMVCTKSPCPTCAAAIINSEIVEGFIYFEDYKDDTGLEMLQNSGISVHKHARI